MNESIEHNVRFNQQKRIRSFSIDRAELRKLLELLQERANAAGEIEEKHFDKLRLQAKPQTEEQVEKAKKDLREGFRLFITVSGIDGTELTGNIEDIFDSPNFPDEVKTLFFSTDIPLQKYNYYPRNKMTLFLDFERPSVLNFSIMPSQETANASNIEVNGSDATWVNGVFQEFINYVSRHPSTIPWLHRHTVYDVLVWILGLPLGFWICSKISHLIETQLFTYSPFLQAALYVYIFLASLILLRVAFHYARWIWPLTEFQSERSTSRKHKAIFGIICSGIGISILYDVLKWLVK
jgi:hypothetical protein